MDGKLLHTMPVETKPSKLVYFNPYSEEQMRLYLPEGDHVFRAAFVDDDFVKALTAKEAYDRKKNKFIGFHHVRRTVSLPRRRRRAARRSSSAIRTTGAACVEKIVSNLAHHAYRRPVTKAEIASLLKFVALAKANGNPPSRAFNWRSQAMLVSPHFLFRIEHDPNPLDAAKAHRISDLELASRLSYFLWSSMPDDELLGPGRSRQTARRRRRSTRR